MEDIAGLSIAGLSDPEALIKIGELIDDSRDAKSASGTDLAFVLLDELKDRTLAPEVAVLVHYFRANAWDNRRLARTEYNSWAWEQTENQQQILELRRAAIHEGFGQLNAVRQCQILTNLANLLDHMGRFIEAVEIWNRALLLEQRFAMARGNLGRGLNHYADALYDRGHAAFMLIAAHDALAASTADDAFYEGDGYQGARSGFEDKRQQIASRMDVDAIRQNLNPHHHSLGKSAGEKRYRTWCLQNCLFINPLNDLGPLPIAARDVLTLSSLTVSIASARPPALIGFFNQMKQEFVSARLLYFEGLRAEGTHFSDLGVLLYNTLDYPAYSLATEKMRASFRLAYSLFDKISFFLNDYFKLGLNPRQVSFRSVWYEAKGPVPRPLLQRFATYKNWPLRGLFWLSKDLFEDDFQLVTEPDAAELNDIRNHLEHKYLQLHLEYGALDGEPDPLRYALSRSDFAAKTLRLLKLVRAALIYLSLAVHREERLRGQSKQGITVSSSLAPWKDDWKRL